MPATTVIKSIADKFSQKQKLIFLLITIVSGIIILWPLHNFQHYLAPGDHGRDLYAYMKTLDGALPYRDYSWLFGPLMPYYYGLCFLVGGISIQSVLLGQGLLILMAGVLVYLICAAFLPAALSFVCAFWYWSFRGTEFFYTYNHIGGVVALLTALYCVFQHIRTNKKGYVYAGFFSILLLMLIRLNMGVFILAAFTCSLIMIDLVHKSAKTPNQRRRYFFLSLATLSVAAVIYGFLLHPLPDYAIYQSFPYGKIQRTDASASIADTLIYTFRMLSNYFTASPAQKILGILLLFCLLQSCLFLFSKKSPQDLKRRLFLIFGSLFIFLFFGAHEYVASGVFYRLFWIFPVLFILIFYLIGVATKNISSSLVKTLIVVTFLLPAWWNINNINASIRNFKNPLHELNIGKNKIYTLQHPFWFQTVRDGVSFIKENARADEKILVVPFDSLYLFLTGHDSATRQIVFFDHIRITDEQEENFLREMEAEGANWAIISSRSVSLEGGMGTFGKTYCLRLAQYLDEHFEVVATFGDWMNPGGWGWNHGIKILKRIQ